MVSDPKMNVGKRRRLAPSEKYEIYVAVLTGQATQREAAERFGVDRSTVVHVCRTAKQGALAALAASVPGRRSVPTRFSLVQVQRHRLLGDGGPQPLHLRSGRLQRGRLRRLPRPARHRGGRAGGDSSGGG